MRRQKIASVGYVVIETKRFIILTNVVNLHKNIKLTEGDPLQEIKIWP